MAKQLTVRQHQTYLHIYLLLTDISRLLFSERNTVTHGLAKWSHATFLTYEEKDRKQIGTCSRACFPRFGLFRAVQVRFDHQNV